MPETSPESPQATVASPTPAPAVEPSGTPARNTSQPSIIDQYELGDTAWTPEADLAITPDTRPAAEPKSAEIPAAVVPPAAIHHSKRTLRMANDLGLSQEMIDRTPADVLDDLVYDLNRQQLALSRDHQRQEILQGGPKSPASGATPPGTNPPSPEEPNPEIDLGIDESEYDAGLIGAIKKAVAGPMKEIAALKAQLGEYTQREVLREQKSTADRADSIFKSYPQLFGDKTREQLAEDSPDFIKRMAVLGTLRGVAVGRDFEQRLHQAIKNVYGDAAGTQTPAPPAPPSANGRQAPPQDPATGRFVKPAETPEQERWQRGGVARPTQRHGGAEPPGEKKALQTAARIMKEQGLLEDDDVTLEGIPE